MASLDDTRFLATLAAQIAPDLCLADPEHAIAAARRLLDCAERSLRASDDVDDEALRIQAARADRLGLRPMAAGNLTMAEAFELQKEERFWRGKRREGAYKSETAFAEALRAAGLRTQPFPGEDGRPAEWMTSESAVQAFFDLHGKKRRGSDAARKASKQNPSRKTDPASRKESPASAKRRAASRKR